MQLLTKEDPPKKFLTRVLRKLAANKKARLDKGESVINWQASQKVVAELCQRGLIKVAKEERGKQEAAFEVNLIGLSDKLDMG